MENNSLYVLWMMQCVKPSCKTIYKMLRMFSSPDQAYKDTDGNGLDPLYFSENEIYAFKDHSLQKAYNMLEYCEKKNIKIITFYDKEYPSMLREIATPPMALFIKGNLPDTTTKPSITIVGTRQCSEKGKKTAARLAYDLSLCGFTIVSGMAKGIDTYAHKGCLLANKSPTVAVLAGNVEDIYPKENDELYHLIENNGAVISENLPLSPTVKWGFHQRNRILSGMTYGTIVVESAAKGGSMITVKHALDQNKTIFAVPGDPDCKQCEGTNDLIKNGAILCTDAKDIINEFRFIFHDQFSLEETCKIKNEHTNDIKQRKQKNTEIVSSLNDTEKKLLSLISPKGTCADELCQLTGMQFFEIIPIMQSMEMKGCIKQITGSLFVPIK